MSPLFLNSTTNVQQFSYLQNDHSIASHNYIFINCPSLHLPVRMLSLPVINLL